MERIVAGAIAAGAKLEIGGRRASGFNSGHFFEPTVLTDCTDDMPVMAEENFGPIAAISRFSEEEDVLARANASEMGLSAYAFTPRPPAPGELLPRSRPAWSASTPMRWRRVRHLSAA